MPGVASLPFEMIERLHWPANLFGFQKIGMVSPLQQRAVRLVGERGAPRGSGLKTSKCQQVTVAARERALRKALARRS